MKKLFTTIICVLGVHLLSAQLPQKIGGPQGYEMTTAKAISWLVAPTYADTPFVPTALRNVYIGAIVQRIAGGDTSYFGWTGYRWKYIGGAYGSSSSSTSTGNTGCVVYWSGVGFKYYITAGQYYINNRYYTTGFDSVTLDVPHASLGRRDVIGLDTTGHAFKITGTPAATPAVPFTDALSQYYLSTVYVGPSTTAPSGITDYLMYDENVGPATEWATTYHSGTVDPNSTVTASNGTKSIYFNNAITADYIALYTTAGEKITDKTNLHFKVKLTTFGASADNSILVMFTDGGIGFIPNGTYVQVKHGRFGLDTTNKTSWQLITIPVSYFGLQNDSANSLMFINYGNGTTYSIDQVGFQSGISAPSTGGSGVKTYNGRSGDVKSLKSDYSDFFQSKITLTTTGTSGAATLSNDTLNIPHYTGGGGATLINGAANVGSGAQIFKDTSSNKINLRSIIGGSGLTVTQNANDITIASTGGSTSLKNMGSGYKLAKEGQDSVKSITAGYRITLDSSTNGQVKISLDSTTQTLTDASTITFNASLGVSAKVTITANRTLAFSNFSAGTYLTLVVIQDGTGGHTLTLPTCKVINGGAGAVTLTTAANAEDILTFFKIGTTIYCNYGKNYN